MAISAQDGKCGHQNARIRHKRAIVAPLWPQNETIIVGSKSRLEHVPKKRLLDDLSFLVRKRLVKPIIGERDGDSNLSTIEKRLDYRSCFPAVFCGERRQCAACRTQRIVPGGPVAYQGQKGNVYKAARSALYRGP